MKKMTLDANLLADIIIAVDQLTPEQKGTAGVNAVDGNRFVLKALADCTEANKGFMDAMNDTNQKLKDLFEATQKEAEAMREGKTPEEAAKINAAKTKEYQAGYKKIQDASQTIALKEKQVECSLSDEKHAALLKVFPLTVARWNDSSAFVDAADALEEAVEA